MEYDKENEAKANFDQVYVAPTPHDYIAMMAVNGYEIGEQARPYCAAAADLLRRLNRDAWQVHMLDVGCSYGIGSAFVKYGCLFDEMVAFFSSRAPRDYHPACDATRMWLNVTPPVCDLRAVGLDSSAPAIRFAVAAGLLDGGIPKDLEKEDEELGAEDIAWLRSCNLMISTGAVGYVTERTIGIVLDHLGQDYPTEYGPFAVLTILRMFDPAPIAKTFQEHGFRFGPVPGLRLPQRRFTGPEEMSRVISMLRERGLDTREWEEKGKQFADLYIAAPPRQFPLLSDHMVKTRTRVEGESRMAGYIRR